MYYVPAGLKSVLVHSNKPVGVIVLNTVEENAEKENSIDRVLEVFRR